jgi:hypothetical protein
LYEVPATDTGECAIEPVENGGIPAWLGEVTDIAVVGDPVRVFVSGNGVAGFDGEAWTEEVLRADGRILALDGYAILFEETGEERLYVAAAGENGRLMLRDMPEWTAVPTGISDDLVDVVIHLDDQDQPFVTAVGDDGVLLQTGSANGIVCRLENVNGRVLMRSQFYHSDGGFNLLTDTSWLVRFRTINDIDPASGPLPENVIDMASSICSYGDYAGFFISETGLFGEEFRFCPTGGDR